MSPWSRARACSYSCPWPRGSPCAWRTRRWRSPGPRLPGGCSRWGCLETVKRGQECKHQEHCRVLECRHICFLYQTFCVGWKANEMRMLRCLCDCAIYSEGLLARNWSHQECSLSVVARVLAGALRVTNCSRRRWSPALIGLAAGVLLGCTYQLASESMHILNWAELSRFRAGSLKAGAKHRHGSLHISLNLMHFLRTTRHRPMLTVQALFVQVTTRNQVERQVCDH